MKIYRVIGRRSTINSTQFRIYDIIFFMSTERVKIVDKKHISYDEG